MIKLKPLEEISIQNSGDLLLLKLESSNSSEKEKGPRIPGYFFNGKFKSLPGNSYPLKETYVALKERAVDITDGTYLGSKILGYEVVRKFKKEK